MNIRNSEGYPDPTAAEAIANVIRGENQRRKPCVYICSPYAGNIVENTKNAIKYLRFAANNGVVPFAPHLLYPQALDEGNPTHRELGLFFGMVWLSKCDEIWVFGDYISVGMKAEIEKATRRRMPVRYFTDDCEEVDRQ